MIGGGGRTRTYEGVSQRIYSPPPLPLGTLPREPGRRPKRRRRPAARPRALYGWRFRASQPKMGGFALSPAPSRSLDAACPVHFAFCPCPCRKSGIHASGRCAKPHAQGGPNGERTCANGNGRASDRERTGSGRRHNQAVFTVAARADRRSGTAAKR